MEEDFDFDFECECGSVIEIADLEIFCKCLHAKFQMCHCLFYYKKRCLNCGTAVCYACYNSDYELCKKCAKNVTEKIDTPKILYECVSCGGSARKLKVCDGYYNKGCNRHSHKKCTVMCAGTESRICRRKMCKECVTVCICGKSYCSGCAKSKACHKKDKCIFTDTGGISKRVTPQMSQCIFTDTRGISKRVRT